MIHTAVTPNASVPTIAELAERVAADGFAAHHDAVVLAVQAAGLATRFPVLTDVVVDGTAPPVARARAIGQLAALLGAQVRSGQGSALTPARRPRAA